MKQTWRWFGPDDTVSLSDIRQAGATGIVSALHDAAPGKVWTREDIRQRRQIIEQADLEWSVVESLPVSEEIKTGSAAATAHIKNYIESLHNLAAEGLEVICYNFMPVLDWTRTQLRSKRSSGALSMRFDLVDFAAFDIHILQRSGAAATFPSEVVEAANHRFAQISEVEASQLSDCITTDLPGATTGHTLATLRTALGLYDKVDEAKLRANMHHFVKAVMPQANELGLRLCCHPDDPPFALLGLPRIVSTEADLRALIDAAPNPANGITLCSGSLGVRADNDLVGMMQRLGPHVHFLHLRNTRREQVWGNLASFHEDEHLAGHVDMIALIAAIVAEEARRSKLGRTDINIPMRPDHGQEILSDIGQNSLPGYPAIGRLKGLAELRGAEAMARYHAKFNQA